MTDCVIGVPVYFNDEQRHAMLAASKIAGLNCLRLLSETSAVALGYGIYKTQLPAETEKPWRVVFCDIGSASVQMSVCEFVKGRVTVLCTAHDHRLGGRDFDEVLYEHFVEEFKGKYKMDVSTNVRAAWKLRLECEKLKQSMSANSTKLPLNIECLMNDKDVSSGMARTDFEVLAAPLLERLRAVCLDLLAQLDKVSSHGLSNADLDAIEVVGGAVRTPAIKQVLQDVFAKEISTTLNLDEIVAKGCALYAAIASPNFRVREFEVVEKTPYSISLTWPARDGKDNQPGAAEIFAAHSKSHGSSRVVKAVTYNRSADCEFEARYTNPDEVVGACATIAHYKLSGIQANYDGTPAKVKILLCLDSHGCFQFNEAKLEEKLPPPPEEPAAAADKPKPEADAEADASQPMDTSADGETKAAADDDKKKAADDDKKKAAETPAEPAAKKVKTTKSTPLIVTVTRPHVLSDAEIQLLIEKENQLSDEDRKEVEKSNAKNALEEYLYYIRDKLIEEDIKPFIKEADAEAFSAALNKLEEWIYEEGEDQEKSVYVAKLNELKKVGDPTLARHDEAQRRPAAEDAFRKAIVRVRKFLEQRAAGDEQYAHLADDDVAKVQAELDAKEKWLNQQTAAQAQLLPYEPPAITVAKLDAERDSFESTCNRVINKPKPKVEPPKKKDDDAAEAKTDDTKADGQPTADDQPKTDDQPAADDGSKMDTSE